MSFRKELTFVLNFEIQADISGTGVPGKWCIFGRYTELEENKHIQDWGATRTVFSGLNYKGDTKDGGSSYKKGNYFLRY